MFLAQIRILKAKVDEFGLLPGSFKDCGPGLLTNLGIGLLGVQLGFQRGLGNTQVQVATGMMVASGPSLGQVGCGMIVASGPLATGGKAASGPNGLWDECSLRPNREARLASQIVSWVSIREPRVHVEKFTFGRDHIEKHSGDLDKAGGHDGDVDFDGSDLGHLEI